MPTAAEIFQHALQLPEDQRANLAADILSSLPTILGDDDGIQEAIRRSEELDKPPEVGVTWDELKSSLVR